VSAQSRYRSRWRDVCLSVCQVWSGGYSFQAIEAKLGTRLPWNLSQNLSRSFLIGGIRGVAGATFFNGSQLFKDNMSLTIWCGKTTNRKGKMGEIPSIRENRKKGKVQIMEIYARSSDYRFRTTSRYIKCHVISSNFFCTSSPLPACLYSIRS